MVGVECYIELLSRLHDGEDGRPIVWILATLITSGQLQCSAELHDQGQIWASDRLGYSPRPNQNQSEFFLDIDPKI